METLDVIDEQDTAIPEDYAAFTKYRDTGELPAGKEEEKQAPTTGEEEESSSEPADEAGQTAADSDSGDAAQQEEEEEEKDQAQEEKPKGARMSKRMRQLSGENAALKSRLAALENPADAGEEADEEAASSTESAEAAEDAAAPMLKDFEDTDTESAWDQYEKATKAFNKAETARAIQAALKEQRTLLDQEHTQKAEAQAKAVADAEWNKAAARFTDYNDVVSDKVQISAAMEAVMRMDPEAGTALAYYMGQHPEESLRIAKATLATNEKEWTTALARAGMELGTIRAKLPVPGKPASKSPTAAQPPTTTKKVTTASKPPTQIRGGVAAPHTDVMSEEDAGDYGKWNRQREKEIAVKQRR